MNILQETQWSPESEFESESESESEPEPELGPVFTRFSDLPPELRHQIWRAAVPSSGINFFNVHCIPNDHAGANRSTSPPWLYIDLRRLSIQDDDAKVAEYDPSAWQAREALRRTCREARLACTLPETDVANIILTRPKRGLFLRAGDGQLRNLVPWKPPDNDPNGPTVSSVAPGTEPLERRMIGVRKEDVLCLSLENCSFNLPHEEAVPIDSDRIPNDQWELGWAYDPQLMPGLPDAIPASKLCISVTREDPAILNAIADITGGLLTVPALPMIMFDAQGHGLGDRRIEDLIPKESEDEGGSEGVFWDRFGDRYIQLRCSSGHVPAKYRLVKIYPEVTDIRRRYLLSATIPSPKRPFAHSS
ncbi:hypothetical protein F4819DRAFT_502648 [Hypoxylon fuscum]|nr:hypothetical protein F4819DRAFT_502648 [Hypoxylon fuscum]